MNNKQKVYAKLMEEKANMNDKQKLAELKEQEKDQKAYIKEVKKEYKSTISKLKKSCQTRTKKYNKEMKQLSKKTLDLKLEKEKLEACERIIESKKDYYEREIAGHEEDLDEIIVKIHKLK